MQRMEPHRMGELHQMGGAHQTGGPSFDALLGEQQTVAIRGYVTQALGLTLRAVIPGVCMGDLVEVLRQHREPLLAEVAGFEGDECLLMPFGDLGGLAPRDAARHVLAQRPLQSGPALLGQVLDGLGRPMTGGQELSAPEADAGWLCGGGAVRAPDPCARPPIETAFVTGIRAIDGLCTLGKGQRIGIFAGSGVGKTSLLGQLARHAEADVVVLCLVGERGREVRDFLDRVLGPEGRARSVVVCATSDQPALVRVRAAEVATRIAESFRDQGKHVVLLVDSLTRYVRAARDMALALGEMPARRGIPVSALARLPGLLERAGPSPKGSITGMYTVLVEGGDLDEPISDEVRGLLDGHLVLSRGLAERGRYPAIDVPRSLSRLMDRVTLPAQQEDAIALRKLVSHGEDKRTLVALGAYQPGSDPLLDRALALMPRIESFLSQGSDEHQDFARTREQLSALLAAT